MPSISKISSGSVKKIVAGQVVIDLAGCVKELLENALDSGATTIKVNLYNQGLDVVEVIDNGIGVGKGDRPMLCEKHATSKLKNFESLYEDGEGEVTSFGFRGEALFSLAQLSDQVVFLTKTKEEAIGQRLVFGRDGQLNEVRRCKIFLKMATHLFNNNQTKPLFASLVACVGAVRDD